MNFRVVVEGFVSQRPKGTATSAAAGARTVLTRGGELLCSFMVQSGLGINDFQPLLARSNDGGVTWGEATAIWPELLSTYSIFGSISSDADGTIYFYGSRTAIEVKGEPFWSQATQGLKQNELVWCRSRDEGRTWSAFSTIPMPIPGSAEAPGPLCATRNGSWVVCYAPYNTFDPNLPVAQNQVMSLMSCDKGATWSSRPMLQFPHSNSVGAEAWVIELSDGRLLGTGWHIHPGTVEANAYAISDDGGASWGPTLATGTLGQSTALAPLPDKRALFIYNQRSQGRIGVWLAVARPTEKEFGIELNDCVWAAEVATQSNTSGQHSDWTDFAFGEPSVRPMPDGTFFIAFWCMQSSGYSIRYVKLVIDR